MFAAHTIIVYLLLHSHVNIMVHTVWYYGCKWLIIYWLANSGIPQYVVLWQQFSLLKDNIWTAHHKHCLLYSP